jgi:hypothetical protein
MSSFRVLGLSFVFVTRIWAQADPPDGNGKHDATRDNSNESQEKRVLGIVPNYRTTPVPVPYEPITVREKWVMARQDSFDRGTVALGAIVGAESQLTRSNPPFGQGASGYSRYFAAAYGDFVVGNFMTEAVFPTLLHQDPRYFRRGKGSTWSRLGYALGQTFWVHSDSGRMQFNYSEILGNSAAVAISTSYYSNNTATNALGKLAMQVGFDAGANVLKEFSSDINRKLLHRRHGAGPGPTGSF